MGFLGDAFKEFLIGDAVPAAAGPFGHKISSNDKALSDLYRLVYFDFGLVPFRNLNVGSRVPVTTNTFFGGSVLGFEIRGNIHSPRNFMSNGWGNMFHTLAREFPTAKGRVWAYDIRRLDESILVGSSVYPGDEAYKRSEEYLKVLRLVGSAVIHPLSRVPAVNLEFGQVWEQFSIPDRISVSLDSVHPFTDDHMKNVINLIIHNYGRVGATTVVADYTWNPFDGTLEVVMKDQPVVAPEPAPAKREPDDGFPYDFYRGLGLINDEDMVLIPTILGPLQISMTTDSAKEWLLAYQPKN